MGVVLEGEMRKVEGVVEKVDESVSWVWGNGGGVEDDGVRGDVVGLGGEMGVGRI